MAKRNIQVILPEDQPVKIHDSLTRLPLYKFIEADCDGNLSVLIISGLPSAEELSMSWIDLQQEYGNAVGNAEGELQTELFKEVAELGCNYRLVHLLVKALRLAYSEKFCDTLNEILNRNIKFDYSNQEAYLISLDRAISYSQEIKIQFKMKSEALRLMQGPEETDEQKLARIQRKKTTRENYQGLLITLSDHAKYTITDRIMTYEFCERIKRLRAHQSRDKSKTNG